MPATTEVSCGRFLSITDIEPLHHAVNFARFYEKKQREEDTVVLDDDFIRQLEELEGDGPLYVNDDMGDLVPYEDLVEFSPEEFRAATVELLEGAENRARSLGFNSYTEGVLAVCCDSNLLESWTALVLPLPSEAERFEAEGYLLLFLGEITEEEYEAKYLR